MAQLSLWQLPAFDAFKEVLLCALMLPANCSYSVSYLLLSTYFCQSLCLLLFFLFEQEFLKEACLHSVASLTLLGNQAGILLHLVVSFGLRGINSS